MLLNVTRCIRHIGSICNQLVRAFWRPCWSFVRSVGYRYYHSNGSASLSVPSERILGSTCIPAHHKGSIFHYYNSYSWLLVELKSIVYYFEESRRMNNGRLDLGSTRSFTFRNAHVAFTSPCKDSAVGILFCFVSITRSKNGLRLDFSMWKLVYLWWCGWLTEGFRKYYPIMVFVC